MRFGVCASPHQLSIVEQAGADYIECTVTGINALSDLEWLDFCEQLKKSSLACEALAVLFPGADIPLVGEKADKAAVKAYVEKAFKRVGVLAPEVVVFGSGGARKRPEHYPKDDALAQLAEAGHIIAKAAAPYNITIALEPLNPTETNMINSLAEGLPLVEQVNEPNFKLLADLYHMLVTGEPADALYPCAQKLVHTHIAARVGRACPGPDNIATFKPYFEALRTLGYAGRMSIEASFDDMARQLPQAFSLLRQSDVVLD